MNPQSDRLAQLLGHIEGLDRADRIQLLIDIASRFRPVPQRMAARPYPEDHRVPGCESEAYVWAEPNGDGTLTFHFAVENPQGISAMALSEILRETLSGVPLDEVAAVPADVIYRIFGSELSMGKSLGLMGIVNMVRAAARSRLASCVQGDPQRG